MTDDKKREVPRVKHFAKNLHDADHRDETTPDIDVTAKEKTPISDADDTVDETVISEQGALNTADDSGDAQEEGASTGPEESDVSVDVAGMTIAYDATDDDEAVSASESAKADGSTIAYDPTADGSTIAYNLAADGSTVAYNPATDGALADDFADGDGLTVPYDPEDYSGLTAPYDSAIDSEYVRVEDLPADVSTVLWDSPSASSDAVSNAAAAQATPGAANPIAQAPAGSAAALDEPQPDPDLVATALWTSDQAPAATPAQAPEANRSFLSKLLPTIERGKPTTTAPATPTVPSNVPSAALLSPQPQVVEKPKKKRGCFLTFLLALLVMAVGAYLAGVVATMRYFLPNTTINGEDVSYKTIDEVAEMHAASVSEVSFAVSGVGIDLQLNADDLKARYDGGSFARTAISQQHPWAWPLEIVEPHNIEVEKHLIYDAARLNDAVSSAVDIVNKKAKDPVDAKIVFDKKTKRYKVQPEKLGTKIDKTGVLKQVKAAFSAGEAKVELGDDLLIKPEVTSDDEKLNEAVNKVNASYDATQQIVTHGETVWTVGEDELQKWVKLNDDLTVSFDDDACVKWAQGELSSKLDTVGITRNFSLPDGRQITVSGGTYGWVCNGADIAERVGENVRAGKAADVEVSFLVEGGVWNPGGNDWGDKYIEIDLGSQHVKYFDGSNVIWEADCVSGGLVGGKMHSTPTGVYSITSFMTSGNVELRGEIDPKTNEPEYISYVKYWMPFIGNSHALHDADWRSDSEFGGNTYTYAGSHGCVNLPAGKAAELYNMVSVGTVVVVHD